MGADVELDKVELTIKGVEAQVLLKVRLEQVRAILDKALTTIGENPEILQSLVQTVDRTLGEVGGAAREAVGEGGAVSQLAGGVGDAAEQAVGQVGQTANRAVGQVTQQAGRLLEERVNEAGQTVQWVVGESGSVVERTLNDSGKVLNEAVVDDASNPGSEGEHSWSECSRRRHGKEEHPMWTKRAGDLIGAFVVGNGVLDLIAPRQRVFLLVFGPERLRKLALWFADHPTAMRLRGIARIGTGIWLALRQYRAAPQPSSWHQRWPPNTAWRNTAYWDRCLHP